MPVEAIKPINNTQTISKPNKTAAKPVEKNKNDQKTLIAVGAGLALVTLGFLGHKYFKGAKKHGGDIIT